MSTVATIVSISSVPASEARSFITARRNEAFSNAIFMFSKPPLHTHHLFLGRRNSSWVKRISISKAIRPNISPAMQWQHCRYSSRVTHAIIQRLEPQILNIRRVNVEVDVPCSVAYSFYSDREATPRWLPLISSVKVLEDKPDLSRWSLEHEVFGQKFEFSWLSMNLQPIPNQKIHWRSLDGVHNKGATRFYPKGPSSCLIEINVSFEVPPILIPVSSTLRPFLEGMLLRGLERFGKVAKYHHANNHKV